jgi:hypothetical protein
MYQVRVECCRDRDCCSCLPACLLACLHGCLAGSGRQLSCAPRCSSPGFPDFVFLLSSLQVEMCMTMVDTANLPKFSHTADAIAKYVKHGGWAVCRVHGGVAV